MARQIVPHHLSPLERVVQLLGFIVALALGAGILGSCLKYQPLARGQAMTPHDPLYLHASAGLRLGYNTNMNLGDMRLNPSTVWTTAVGQVVTGRLEQYVPGPGWIGIGSGDGTGGGTGGVISLNSLTGEVALVAGSGIGIATNGQELTLSVTGLASKLGDLTDVTIAATNESYVLAMQADGTWEPESGTNIMTTVVSSSSAVENGVLLYTNPTNTLTLSGSTNNWQQRLTGITNTVEIIMPAKSGTHVAAVIALAIDSPADNNMTIQTNAFGAGHVPSVPTNEPSLFLFFSPPGQSGWHVRRQL